MTLGASVSLWYNSIVMFENFQHNFSISFYRDGGEVDSFNVKYRVRRARVVYSAYDPTLLL